MIAFWNYKRLTMIKIPITKVDKLMIVADDDGGAVVGASVGVTVGASVGVTVGTVGTSSPLDLWYSVIQVSIFKRCAFVHTLLSAIISLARAIVLLSMDVRLSAAASTLLNYLCTRKMLINANLKTD